MANFTMDLEYGGSLLLIPSRPGNFYFKICDQVGPEVVLTPQDRIGLLRLLTNLEALEDAERRAAKRAANPVTNRDINNTTIREANLRVPVAGVFKP